MGGDNCTSSCQASLEQRCSQLVGISILVTNLTGSLPKYVRLKSLGFATRPLGRNYIMVGPTFGSLSLSLNINLCFDWVVVMVTGSV